MMGMESHSYFWEASKIWHFFACFFKDIPGADEAMGYKPTEPVGNVDDIVVTFFLVHGCHDLVEFGIYGGVIALPAVEKCILTCD